MEVEEAKTFEITRIIENLSSNNLKEAKETILTRLRVISEENISKVSEYVVASACGSNSKSRLLSELCGCIVEEGKEGKLLKKHLSLHSKKEFDKKTVTVLSLSQFVSYCFLSGAIPEALVQYILVQQVSIANPVFQRVKATIFSSLYSFFGSQFEGCGTHAHPGRKEAGG